MRRTRAAFHRAVRQVKRDAQSILRQRFAESMLSAENRGFWTEVKKLTRQRVAQASVVDNNSNPHDTASCFAQKHSELYSSVSNSEADMKVIESELVRRIEHSGFDDGYVV